MGPEKRRDQVISDLMDVLQEALKAVDPQTILNHVLSLKGDVLGVDSLSFDLSQFKRVLVIGGGKASGKMAAAVERMLGARITSGVVNIPDYLMPKPRCRRITLHEATHPVPSEKGIKGVEMMVRLVGHPTSRDLVICLISGGGSALLPFPIEGINLRDVQQTTHLLLKSGAEISEINTVRKHLSAIKGGRLAERLYPATVLSLIISDVVGDELDAIASGPTAPDMTTYADAEAVLKKYGLWPKVSTRIRDVIEKGVAGTIRETPKEGSKVFEHVHNVLVGSNRLSCLEAANTLRKRGYSTLVLSTRISGEAREIGRLFAGIAKDMVENQLPFATPACIVAGGETTVTVHGNGVGGRNQELVLSAALEIDGLPGAYVASMGTDGVDGPTKAAGAVADGALVQRARNAGVDPVAFLRHNDSNSFFKRIGGLIVTGPTGTNVNDIMIVMVNKQ